MFFFLSPGVRESRDSFWTSVDPAFLRGNAASFKDKKLKTTMTNRNQVNKDFPDVPEIVRTAPGRMWSEPSTGHWQTDSGKVYVQNNQEKAANTRKKTHIRGV